MDPDRLKSIPLFSSLSDKALDTLSVFASETSVSTGKRLVQQNPALVERFLRASLKGTRFLKSERKKAIEIGVRYWKSPEAEVAEYYDDIVPNLEDWGEINTKGLSRAIALIAKQRNQTPPQVQDFIDVRFINAIKQARK